MAPEPATGSGAEAHHRHWCNDPGDRHLENRRVFDEHAALRDDSGRKISKRYSAADLQARCF